MARFKIYSKDGQTVRYEGCPKYNGTYLKVSYLEFSSIASPTPIVWQVGDYVDYPRTGLRYTLRSIPSVRKKAKSGQTGDAFVYQNVQFMAQTQDLAVAPFIDLVPGDNGVHFSTQSAVSTFENAYGIAARIQACLDDLFPGVWDVKVYENLDGDFEKKISEAVDFSIDGGTCLEACDRMYDTWGIGWTHYKDSTSGKDVLLFGRPNTRTSDNTSPDFIFGPGSGLTALKKSVANSDEIGTRLRVFGSSRNIPTSYYRGLDIYNGEGADIQNLMIPLSKWGKTDGKPDARKAYLQASDEVVAALGLIPRTHYFDGSDGEEIYPSLEGATVGDVRAAKQELQDTTYVPSQTVYPDASERVDEIEAAANPEDDGYSGGSDGSKYKDTQVVSYAGVNRQQVHVSSNVRPEQYGDPTEVSYYIFSQVPLSKDDAVTVESGMEGYIEDANGIIYSDAGSVKVVLTLQSGTSTNGNLASKSVETTKEGNRYNFRLPEITLEHPSDYTDMNLRLTITVKASRSANSFFYVNLSGHDFLLGEYTPIKGDFTLTLKQIGFDISQRAPLTADGLARIYMVDGMNAGRSFYVRSCSYTSGSDTWLLGMYRTEDESTGMRYPNSQFPINPGDHFLLLDIAMPELYVGLASQRLYEKGIEMLNDISRVKPYYEPEVDAIVMTEQARVLREGMYMRLTDTDIAGDSSEYVLIDTLTINEGEAEIPTYKVGLREYKKKTFQETTKAAIDDISQKASGGSSGRPSSSTAQSYDALSDKPKIDGVTLEGDRDSYNELGLINKSIFELVNIGTEESPLMAIRAKYGLFSDSFISARGSDPEAGSGGSGGLDVQAMWYALGQPTGEQINASHIPNLAISKITGLQAALDSKLESITKAMVEGVLTGTITSHDHDGMYAPLSGGLIPSQYLPSYVDDVVEYASLSAFPASGEGGKIYVALDTNLTYRWGGTSYVEISPSLALGHTSGTAYPGDEGAALAERVESMKVITDLFGIDGDGNVYVKDNRGFWSNSFISARGSDPEAGSGGGGSGVDMASVWYALAQPTNEKINVSHIPELTISKITGLQGELDSKLSGITGEMVTEALGYTPYDASRISTASVAYAASAGKVENALTINNDGGSPSASAKSYNGSAAVTINIPTTLPASDVYSWAKQPVKPSYTFSEIGSKPSTLSGYGITDGVNAAEATGHLTVSVSGHKLTIGVASGYTIPTASQITLWDKVGGLFDVDEDGNVYVKDNRGFYGNSFISARGSDPEAGTSGGGGLDEDALWDILGTPGTEKIDISHIPELSLTDVTGLEEALNSKLSGITGQMVKDALGYTPYDAAAIGSASVAYATSSGTAGKVAHALTVKHDGGSSSASAKTYNGSAAVTVTIPTTLPASDVYAWAKAATKPSYTWGEIGGKPSVFTPAPHTHPLSDISDLHASWDALLKSAPSAYVTRWPAWGEVTGKPSAFTPAEHTHVKADITDFPTSWAWSAITGKPSTLTGYGITDGVNSVEASGGLSASVSGHKLTVGVASGYAVPTSAQISAWNLVASLFGVDSDGNVYVKDGKGFYGQSFVSSRGSDPGAGSGGGSGVDMESVWYAMAQPTTEKINVSHIPLLQQLSGALTNAQLANSAITVAGVRVSLGGAVTTAQIASALTGSGYKLTDNDTTYTLTKSGSTITLTGSDGRKTSVTDSNTTYTLGSFGITATAAEINKLDGLATTAAELGYVHGVTSPIQEQLNSKANTSALSAYLPLAGGAMSGNINLLGANSSTLRVQMNNDNANYRRGIAWESVNHTLIAEIGYKNFGQLIYLNPISNEITDVWTDAVGKYSLVISKDLLTYNTYPLLHSGNYTSYTVTKTGGGASGWWPINVTGAAERSNVLSATTDTAISNYVRYRHVSGSPSLVGSTAGGGAWGLPSTGPDAEYANGQILRLGWSPEYYTDIFTGPNDFGSAAGIQFRQVVAGKMSSRGWRTLLDTANYAGTLDTRYLLKSAYTASDILAKLKTVDGSGSGLDADLLDGTQKSGLLTSVASTAATNLSVTVGGTVKSVADLYATYLDGHPATSFDLSTNLGACQDYGVYVIGLMQITDYTTAGNMANGTLIFIRQNGNNPAQKIIYSLSTRYNTDNVRFGYLTLSTNIYVQPCTFTYNGKKWAGFQVSAASSYSTGVVCVRDGLRIGESSTPFLLKYAVLNTGAVINSEVNSSVVINGADIIESGVHSNAFFGNASSATKLATARSIWGQTFDGTQGVDGHLYLGSPTYRLYFGKSGLTSFITGEDSGYFSIKSANNTAVAATLLRINLSNGAVSGSSISLSSHLAVSGAEGRGITCTGNHIRLKAATGGWAIGIEPYHNDNTTSFSHSVGGAYGANANTINYTYYGGTYNSPAMVILPNKMVGIGRTDPWYTLDVNGTIRAGVGIWSNGYVSAKGQDTTSDARYKKDIAALPAQAALAVLMRLRPATWAWKDDGRRGAGFVAQEVMGVLPEAVREVGDGDDRHLALNYQMLHAYEVCLLQTHETELERLRGRVNQLENEIKRIRHES